MNDKTENKKLYLVVTAAKYWGTGNTAVEAAEAANVGSSWVKGYLAKADPRFFKEGSLKYDDFGACAATFTEEFCDMLGAYDDDDTKQGFFNKMKDAVSSSLVPIKGEFRLSKGKLLFKGELD